VNTTFLNTAVSKWWPYWILDGSVFQTETILRYFQLNGDVFGSL